MRNAHQAKPRAKARRMPGAALLTVVLALLALGGMAATMSQLGPTGAVQEPVARPSRQAYYAAEAGLRLVAAQYNAASGTSDKNAVFRAVSGKTFTLDAGAREQFTMNVYSYGYQVQSHDAATHTITARAVQKVPLTDMQDSTSGTLTFPAGSMISVQDEIGNDVPVTLAQAGNLVTNADGSQTLTFVYLPLATGIPLDASAGLDFVNVAYATTGSPSGSASAVTGLPAGMASFPEQYGRVAIKGQDKTYTYKRRVVSEGGSVTLEGLEPETGSFSLSDFRNQILILRKAYAFQSTGSVGTGDFASTKTLVAYDAPKSDASTLDPTDSVTDPSKAIETTMNDLTAFNSNDIYVREGTGQQTKVVDIQSYISSQGTHVAYAAIHSLVFNNGNNDWGHVLRLNKEGLFRWRWKQDTRLSYDVQTKIATGWKLPFAAFGLSLRLQETGVADEYNFYGVSFMKYYASGPRPNGIHGDYMPDGFKPPGEGTVTRTWPYRPEQESSYPLDITETDRILLVFWRRVNGVSTWLAYKELAYSPWNSSAVTGDRGVYPKQWGGDGRIVGDNTTLLVRAEEQFVNGIKVNRFKVFYGDAAAETPAIIARTPDSVAYNIVAGNAERGRARYMPEWDTNRTHAYPVFPALSIGSWNATADFFSFVEDSGGYTVDGTLRQCKWDAVNTTAINALPAADIRILSDGGTIRTQEFLTPNSDTWPADPNDWPTGRPEVGLHAYGRLISQDRFNNAVTFDDLVLNFLLYANTPLPLQD